MKKSHEYSLDFFIKQSDFNRVYRLHENENYIAEFKIKGHKNNDEKGITTLSHTQNANLPKNKNRPTYKNTSL